MPSQLDGELAAAEEALAAHPYLGTAVRKRFRKLLLRRTGFFVIYHVRPKLRVVEIHGLIAKSSLAHR